MVSEKRCIGEHRHTNHKGIDDVLHSKTDLRRGNHNVSVYESWGQRLYYLFDNLIVVEFTLQHDDPEKKGSFMVNPKWVGYSVTTTRSLNCYRAWFREVGYKEVSWDKKAMF
jgi:hypothetical protein